MWSVYIPLYIYNVVARKYVKNFDKGTRHTLFLRARSMSMCVLYDMSRHHKLIYRQIKHCKVRDRSPGHAATINTTLWAKEISKAAGFWFAFLTTSPNGLSLVKIKWHSQLKQDDFKKCTKRCDETCHFW